jgi:hypothetical protein
LYVGMTRGRQANTAHVITGTTAPPRHEPYQQATPESVLAAVMGRDDGDLSATEQIRQAQDWTGGTGHLLTLWTAAIRPTLHPGIDQQITARLTESEAWRYMREPSRRVLHQRLRAAQLAGHDITALIDQIATAPMDGAQSIASVLHGRLQRLALPQLAQHDLTWAQRTPVNAPAVAHEIAAALDARARALGDQLTSPEPWLARHLGVLAPGASPALREEYARRAAVGATYREATGITDPQQAVSPAAHRDSPDLEGMRQATIRALEIRDEADIMHGLTRGELEAHVLAAERTHAAAPPEVSSQLQFTAQAEADAWQQAADAATRHDHAKVTNSQALASQLAAECEQLGAVSDRYEEWSAATSGIRETAARAKAELERRGLTQKPAGQQQPGPGGTPQTMAVRWQQFQADLTATERALERQRATVAGAPWPPQCTRQPEQELSVTPAPEVKPGNQAARLDQLLGQTADATKRLAAKNAEQEAGAQYAARMEREAQIEPEPVLQARAQEQAEAEP